MYIKPPDLVGKGNGLWAVIIFALRFALFTHISWKNAQFQNMCAKKRNDFRQLKRSNFRVEKCKTGGKLS